MKDGRNARYRWQVSWLTAWHFARLPDRSQWHEGIVRRLQLRGQPGRWRDSPHPIPFSSASCTCTQNHRRQDYSPARLKNSVPSPPLQAHPRWRGEHDLLLFLVGFGGGSSPLARGTPRRGGLHIGQRRFIPAGAGNTTSDVADYCTPAVHPRWRGEHVEPWPMVGTSPGSSPLARGTLLHLRLLLQARRFIPAGAGNTQCFCR